MFIEEDEEVFEKSEELIQAETEIGELLKVKDRTVEQETKLKDLKKKRSGEFNKRLGEVVGEKKFFQNQSETERKRAEKLQQELDQLRTKQNQPVKATGNRSKIIVWGEEHYTDQAINSMVEDGEITSSEGWQMQQDRIAALGNEKKEKRDRENNFKTIQQETISEVLRDYPHFDPKHPKHNPNDPLYKEASRILDNGYNNNPKGIKLAIEEAKKILRLNDQRVDLTDDFSVAGSRMSSDRTKSSKKIELEDWEKDNGIRMYNKSGLVNPKTGKTYTEAEAIEKTLQAKTKRADSMAGRN